MRQFSFINRESGKKFNLNRTVFAADPTGLGNSFQLDILETRTEKIILSAGQNFEEITFQLYFNADGGNGYINYKNFTRFLQNIGKVPFVLEYNDGLLQKFCEVVLKSLTKTEIDADGVFLAEITLVRLSYWYVEHFICFQLAMQQQEMTFPLTSPFAFKGLIFQKEYMVQNNFFEDVPLEMTISGNIRNNISIQVTDIDKTIWQEIELKTNNYDGRIIHIDSREKKITVMENGVVCDGYDLTNKEKQSFLFLPHGQWILQTNVHDEDTGSIKITMKEYVLD